MEMNLTYRLYRESDIPELLLLWDQNTRWEQLSADAWRRMYQGTPYGPSLIVVATDEDGKIMSQLVLRPSRVSIDGREIKALRLSAPITRKSISRVSIRKLEHPAFRMFLTGATEAANQGYEIIYGLPASAWASVLRSWERAVSDRSMSLTQFPCMARTIEPIESDESYVLSPMRLDSRYENLWSSAKRTYPISCGVKRSAEWLRYNYDTPAYATIEVITRRDDVLAGYVAIRKRDGLIMDLMARRPSESPEVLAAAINWLASQRRLSSEGWPSNVAAMRTDAVGSTLHALDFHEVDYRFTFFYTELERHSPVVIPSSQDWYITPGD